MSIFEFIKNKINTKNKYDVIYSIGADCGCAGNLKRFKLRITSGPFDWLFKASLEQRFVCLMNDFADFFNIEDFEKFEKDARVNAELQLLYELQFALTLYKKICHSAELNVTKCHI